MIFISPAGPIAAANASRRTSVTMTALEYADKVLHEFRRGKKAASLAKGDVLECLITCTDGSVERVTGYWAHEIMKRADEERAITDPSAHHPPSKKS